MAAYLIPRRFALTLAGFAAGVVLAGAGTAMAQGYGPYDAPSYAGPTENVIVTAPRFHEDNGPRPLDMPPARISLSTSVPVGDLDLTTWQGAHELHMRIRHAARYVCGELRDAYPLHQLPGTSCFRDALQSGMVRADEEITNARYEAWENYAYGD